MAFNDTISNPSALLINRPQTLNLDHQDPFCLLDLRFAFPTNLLLIFNINILHADLKRKNSLMKFIMNMKYKIRLRHVFYVPMLPSCGRNMQLQLKISPTLYSVISSPFQQSEWKCKMSSMLRHVFYDVLFPDTSPVIAPVVLWVFRSFTAHRCVQEAFAHRSPLLMGSRFRVNAATRWSNHVTAVGKYSELGEQFPLWPHEGARCQFTSEQRSQTRIRKSRLKIYQGTITLRTHSKH